ncbi:Capreomycidine synthase [Meyerozyma sp. JA9]|nr:Capreomycidine synthase [Meyerozyma sp. JA9]
MKQEDFGVEKFMDRYETGISNNMGETCCDSLSIDAIATLANVSSDELFRKMAQTKLVYGHITGSPQLKQGIVSLYNDLGANVACDEIVVTNGAIGANFLTFYSVVDPGDYVICVDPAYQQLNSLPNMFSSGNMDKFPIEFEHNYSPDLKKLAAMFQARTPKLLVINNPHNPTGAVWDDDILSQIVDLCRKHDTYLMCDEVYRPLFHGTVRPKSIIDFGYEKTISTGSMSKSLSLAGVRLGWIVSKDKKVVQDCLTKRDYNTICVSMLDDQVASFALEHKDRILERNHKLCADNLAILDEFITRMNGVVTWVRPLGGSTCYLRLENFDTSELARDLAENYSTLVVPGEVFCGRKGFLRVGFGNSSEDLRGGLQVLEGWIEKRKEGGMRE